MMERDTLTLLTVGNIESKTTDELVERKKLLDFWTKSIKTETEFIDYVISLKKGK